MQERYGVGEQRCGDDGVTAAAAGAVPFGGEACGSSVQAAGLAWLAPPTVCAPGPTVNGWVGITECRVRGVGVSPGKPADVGA